MPHYTITANIPDKTLATLREVADNESKYDSVNGAITLLNGINGAHFRAYVRACIASAAASQTVGCDESDAVDGTDDITIGGTTLSVEAAPSGESEFAKGSTDIEFAANLAAAINAHSVLQKIVWAASDGVDTVTIYCVYPGPVGNLVTLAETGNGFTLGAAALASGASDEVDGYQFGHNPA